MSPAQWEELSVSKIIFEHQLYSTMQSCSKAGGVVQIFGGLDYGGLDDLTGVAFIYQLTHPSMVSADGTYVGEQTQHFCACLGVHLRGGIRHGTHGTSLGRKSTINPKQTGIWL